MNLFHVKTVQSQGRLQFQIEDSELVFPVPDKYIHRVRASETYRLGIRPTDIYPVDGNSPCTLSARVSIFEHLGEENRIHIRIREQLLSLITMQDTVYRPGTRSGCYSGRIACICSIRNRVTGSEAGLLTADHSNLRGEP